MGSILRLERSLGGEHGNPLRYSCLENPMDRGALQAMVQSVAESDTTEWLSTAAFFQQSGATGIRTIKKAEYWRTNAFKLLFWRRLLRVLWTARSSSQSILKEINPKYSLEGLMLKLQHFGHLMQRADSLGKTLMLKRLKTKGEEGSRGWDC